MATYQAPRSDDERQAFLQRSLTTGRSHRTGGTPYVSAETLDAIETFLPQYNAAQGAVSNKLDIRSKEIAERVSAIENVQTYTRDLCEVVKRRVYRRNEPVAVLQEYQMTQDGQLPDPGTQEEWLLLGQRVCEGDAKAVALGYAPAVCPSAVELNDVLIAARKEMGEAVTAETAYALAQNSAGQLRPRADELIADVIDQVRFNTRKFDASLQRRILRQYGAQFRYLPGEVPDAEDSAPDPKPVETPAA